MATLTQRTREALRIAMADYAAADQILELLDEVDNLNLDDDDVGTAAAAGTNQSTATELTLAFTAVTAADGAKGVKLPTATEGAIVHVYNAGTSVLLVYPNTSDDINDGSANAAIRVPGTTRVTFMAVDATTWSANFETAVKPHAVPLTTLRVWDAPQTNLPGTSANDDLAIVYNTHLTGAPTIETSDLKAAGATTRYAWFEFAVPDNYVAGKAITLRVNAGMKTTVADTTATLDAEVVRQAAPSTDICATAAQSINSLTAADKDFTITATSVVPGELLMCRLAVAVNDAATGTAVIGQLNSISLRW